MRTGRRGFLSLSSAALAATILRQVDAQQQPDAMGRRVIAPQARPKQSGRRFDARFIDVAATAGLTAPVIYGGSDHFEYIVEANGCGCAFIDFDNDGWIDIFLLSGTRVGGPPPGTTNRLYKNNRNGTFTDVTSKAGLEAVGWANSVTIGDYNNDGLTTSFAHTSAKTGSIATSAAAPSRMWAKKPGCSMPPNVGAPGLRSSTTTATAT